ncbi:DUF4148 domain-containing protein [Paraburkholderia oxyphila]|uniref:DUF4148 domain-containing protein n=1 Tax=Paraburkholderia oxyphila TaxID=614212 RepID=UPI0005B9A4A4|nr:DUF4148 domain-containing protein [Paraburkholderia oxyphila]
MKKSFAPALALAVLIAAPLASQAQSAQPVTHAQRYAELAKLEAAGYNPRDSVHYPENFEAARAKVAAEDAAQRTADASASGTIKTAARLEPAPGL